MNYYERHLGDYAKDTAHLSMLEHGAYGLLLDRYYATECGIPADQVHRLARARTKEEKQAVDSVLDEFFKLIDGVWINNRAADEVTRAQSKIKAAQENGKRGGRPKSNQTETQEKPSGLFLGSENETQTKAHQTPDTRHQTNPIASETYEPTTGTPAGEVCARLLKLGMQSAVTPQHPKLMALLAAGLTVDEIVDVGPDAVAKGKGFAWLLATAEGRRRDAATVGALPSVKVKPWFLLASKIEERARELGIAQQRDEVFPAFRDRIYQAAGVTAEMVRTANIDHGARV